MQSSLNENPEMYIDNSITHSGMIRKTDRLSNKQNLFGESYNILKKSHQNRFPSENQTLMKLVEKSEFLKEVADIQSLDMVKGILRNAKIEFVDERQVIAEEGQSLNYMVVILEGKLAVEKSNLTSIASSTTPKKEEIDGSSIKKQQLFQKLTLLAKKQRDQLRRTSKLQRKSTLPVSQYQFMLPILSHNDYDIALRNIEKTVLINEQFGGKERLNGKLHRNRVFAVEKSTLLVFEMSFLFYWLQMTFKVKMAKNIEQMKTLPIFAILQQQKLGEIILSMKLIKKRKNQVIYFQGEDAEMVYLLRQGQLKVTKEADLFKQNPNDFYVDRRRLIRSMHRDQKSNHSKSLRRENDEVLHFANLTTLFNYRPIKKSIQIGLISSFGMFGEEEIVFKTNRQTTVTVSSIQASFYQIQFKKILEIIGPKLVDRFKEALENSISKKVLYRQSQFAEQVEFQNKSNLDYFYLDEGNIKQSPRKFKLEKINEKVSPHTARDVVDHAPAFYTTFNFNKMFNKRYEPQKKDKKSKNEVSTESLSAVALNQQEQKLVGISHSWNPIEKKVKQQKMLSLKISPFKHQINIEQPLIDQQFFKDVAKEQRRINKEFRTIRFSLGKRVRQ